MKYNLEERKAKIEAMELLLEQVEAQAKRLSDFLEEIDKIDANVQALTAYYTGGEWMQDYDKYHRLAPEGKHYMVLAEDPISDVLQDVYQSRLKLLKKIADALQ